MHYKMHYKECITRCIPYKTVGYSFVEDVMNHKNCMTKYIIKFQRDVSDTFDDNDEYFEISVVREAFL